MDKTYNADSVCIRCGKVRIISKVWVEKSFPGRPITHTETVCPDPICQKFVEEDFAARREKRLKFSR